MASHRKRRRHYRHYGISRKPNWATSYSPSCPKWANKSNGAKPFGTLEAVKTVADLIAPAAGDVLAVNDNLADGAEQINEDPYGGGWLLKIRIDNPADLEVLAQCPRVRRPAR